MTTASPVLRGDTLVPLNCMMKLAGLLVVTLGILNHLVLPSEQIGQLALRKEPGMHYLLLQGSHH